MVRGFVEQQQRWFLQQQFDQRQPHLPAPGEFVGLPLPVFFTETQTHEDSSDLGLNGVAVACAELVLETMVAVGDIGVFRAGVVELCDAVSQSFQFLLHRAQFGKHGHAFGKDCSA